MKAMTVTTDDQPRTIDYLEARCSMCKAIDGTGQILGMVLVVDGKPLSFHRSKPITERDRKNWGGGTVGPRTLDDEAVMDFYEPGEYREDIAVTCHGRKHPFVIPHRWLFREAWKAIAGGYDTVTIPRKFAG